MIDNSTIEIAAEAAVPSEQQVSLGRWRAHLSSGRVRRINAVSLHGEQLDDARAIERLSMVLDLYLEHGLRPRIRTTSMDHWIDPLITRWSESGESIVMVADTRPAAVGETISIDEWLAWLAPRAMSQARFAEAAASARRLEADNVIVTASHEGQTVGAGRAVSTKGITGLFDITVDPGHRRRGHARAMTRQLMGWAHARAESVYLQVAEVNRPAIALYESEGFTERYRYRYRSPD